MMEKKEGIAVYIYRMQDKRDDKSQSPLFLSRAAARYAFGEGGEGSSKEASFRVEKGLGASLISRNTPGFIFPSATAGISGPAPWLPRRWAWICSSIQKEEENIFQSVFSIRWKMNI